MNGKNDGALRRAWDTAFKPIIVVMIAINVLVVFLVAKLLLPEAHAEAYLPFQMVVGLVLTGIQFMLIDRWLRPDHAASTRLNAIVIVGAIAALGISWWVSTERVPREPDREMEDLREKLRGLPRQDAS